MTHRKRRMHGTTVTAAVLLIAAMVVSLPHEPARSEASEIPPGLGGNARLLPNGLYEVRLDDGYVFTTHGPDFESEMLEGHGRNFGPGAPERHPLCATGAHYQHLLYGRPSVITQDRLADVEQDIRAHFRRMNAVLNEEALRTGNVEADYKVLCDENGTIRVDSFANDLIIPYFSTIVSSARAAGFNDPNAVYTIFYDDNFPGVCGFGELAYDERPTVDNRNNRGGYGVTYRSCWFSRTPMHEKGHNMGAVQRGAPYSDGSGHCTDQLDVMCYPSTYQPCSDIMYFDCRDDTYFDAAPDPGEWLANHWNIGSRVNRYILFSDSPGPGDSSAEDDARVAEDAADQRKDPGARLSLSNRNPPRGSRIKATMWLKDCDDLVDTVIRLQRRRGSSFRTVASRRLDDDCRATVRFRANFSTRVFRSFWPQQSFEHRASRSRPQRVTTR